MNFLYSFQFTPLAPQGNDTIQADFQVASSQPSNSKVFFFFLIKFIIGQAKKKEKKKKKKERNQVKSSITKPGAVFCLES